MRATRDKEAEHGLRVEARVFMRREPGEADPAGRPRAGRRSRSPRVAAVCRRGHFLRLLRVTRSGTGTAMKIPPLPECAVGLGTFGNKDAMSTRPRRLNMSARAIVLPAALIALVSMLVLAGAHPAEAHVPGLEPGSGDGPVSTGGPEVSRATYGYLAPGDAYDEYRFTVPEQVTRAVGIIVPAYPEHADFRPGLVITAQGRDQLEIPDGRAAPRQREFEPFSLTYFWHGGEREVTFEPGVLYTLRVQPGPGATSGRYVVVIAGPEQFKARDVADTLWQLPLIWFGAYGGAPFRWNWLALIPFGFTLGVVAVAVMWVRSLLSRRRTG